MKKSMKSLVYTTALLVVFGAPLSSSAVDIEGSFACGAAQELSQAEGGKALKKLQKAYNGMAHFHAGFKQSSYLAALDVSESSSGKVWFQSPGKMKWDYLKPEPQEFLVKDNTYWFYQPEDEQVTIDEFDKVVLTDLPIAFLMGIGDLDKQFSLKSVCRTAQHIVLTLIPKGDGRENQGEEREEIEALQLLVHPVSFIPQGARVRHLGGNSTTVIFDAITDSAEDTSQVFLLQYPENVDIIDRRVS